MIHGLMRGIHPDWDTMWTSTHGHDGRYQRTAMLLQAANMANDAADRAAVAGALGQWLQELTAEHPTYSRFNASRGTSVHDYYKVPGV